jgi:hypothetical protein
MGGSSCIQSFNESDTESTVEFPHGIKGWDLPDQIHSNPVLNEKLPLDPSVFEIFIFDVYFLSNLKDIKNCDFYIYQPGLFHMI